jgi:hypothetical protein
VWLSGSVAGGSAAGSQLDGRRRVARRGRIPNRGRGRGAAAAQLGDPVLLLVVDLGGGPFQLGQPGGALGLGVLVAAPAAGPLAATLPAPAHAANLPALVEVKLRSPKTTSRWRAEYRGWQVVKVMVAFSLPSGPRTLSSTCVSVGRTMALRVTV